MHDPQTLAFDIKSPFKDKSGYRSSLINIWHKDPETDGTDDSCGWFKRARHGDPEVLEKIDKYFYSEWKHWFDDHGWPKFSPGGIMLNMYSTVLWFFYKYDKKKSDNFLRKHTHSILLFAENPNDSMYTSIVNPKKEAETDYLIKHFASVIFGDIIRKNQKWYQHPKWHIHHWKINVPVLRNIRRRWWDKCCVCEKRGFKNIGMSDWSGKKTWHRECDNSAKQPIPINDEI